MNRKEWGSLFEGINFINCSYTNYDPTEMLIEALQQKRYLSGTLEDQINKTQVDEVYKYFYAR